MCKKIKLIIISLLFVIAFSVSICGFVYSDVITKLPPRTQALMVTAHTGCENTVDNSLSSISKGINNGANAVEFDLRFLSDGTPVLAHDKEDKSNQSVTLRQAFDLLRNYECRVNIDVKETDYLHTVQNLIEEYDYFDRCFFTGIGLNSVPAVKNQAPLVNFYLNADLSAKMMCNSEAIKETGRLAVENGALGINIFFMLLSEKNVKEWHNMGLLVSAYTINGSLNISKMLYLGVDNITTLKPSEVSRVLSLTKA